jgi:transposase-like protein
MRPFFPEPKHKERKAIAVDETMIKVKCKWNYLWAAMDVDNKEILSVWILLVFLRKILSLYKRSL